MIKYKEVGIDVEIVVADTDFFTYKLWTTAFCLGILMSNVIILSWFSIVKRVSEVFPKILAQREKNLATFLNFYIPTFVLLLILSLFVNSEAFILNLLILTISNIISLVMFIWLSLYVIKPIKELLLLDQNSSIGKVVKLITKTLRLIVVLGVINIIAPILGVIGLLLYPNNPTEELGTLTAFIEIFAVLVGIVNSTFGLWYSSKLISQN